MKRIVLTSRVIFHLRKSGKVAETHTFEKGKPYEVEDAIAENSFIKERLASVESLKKDTAKKSTPKATAKEAEDVKSASND